MCGRRSSGAPLSSPPRLSVPRRIASACRDSSVPTLVLSRSSPLNPFPSALRCRRFVTTSCACFLFGVAASPPLRRRSFSTVEMLHPKESSPPLRRVFLCSPVVAPRNPSALLPADSLRAPPHVLLNLPRPPPSLFVPPCAFRRLKFNAGDHCLRPSQRLRNR